MSNGNGKRRANNRTGKRQASKGSRAKAASAPSPKRKGLSQDVVDNVKRQVIFGERVGFKNPPKETRFKKGQSGNPKGRPKKTDDVGPGGKDSMTTIILKEGARKVTIREGDETKEIPAIEAVSRAQYLLAIKNGSAYAQKHIIERFDRAEREVRRQRHEEAERWQHNVDLVRTLFVDAEKNGKPPPDIYPHPDDVVIDYENGVRFTGPIDEASAERLKKRIELRDLLYKQGVLEDRVRLDELQYHNTAFIGAQALNQKVPLRFRLTSDQIQILVRRYEVIPKRQLLKQLFRAWREFGLPRRRGWMLPPFKMEANLITLLVRISNELVECTMDVYMERLDLLLPANWERRGSDQRRAG